MKRYLTVDEFMRQGSVLDDSSAVEKSSKRTTSSAMKRKAKQSEKIFKKKPVKKHTKPSAENNDGDSESGSDIGYEDHLTTLENLKSKDPEFYQYLSQNDKGLLNFNLSESDSDDNEEAEYDVRKEKFHKPPESLQVASDDSDFSENEDQKGDDDVEGIRPRRTVVTSALIAEWKTQLETKPKVHTLKTVMLVFQAAVEQASDEGLPSTSSFLVKGPTIFNSVVSLCLTSVLPALHRILGLPPPTKVTTNHQGPELSPQKSKSWPKIKMALRTYLSNIVKMLTVVVEQDVIIVFLRHILYWIPFYVQYPKHSRQLLKRMISFWSTSEESVRVLAFLCIIRVLRILPTSYLDYFLKQLYLSYVNNCKFTSPKTWPLINFMKRSLVELYSLDPNLAYQHAFIYIRQLAIHLRNAMTSRKKDAYQVVYNWQYVHCVLLWSHLLATLHPSPVLAPLLYPLVQVTCGVVNLIQTAKYLPLRFHLIRALTKLSADTDTFIPVLPLVVQVFEIVDFNKGHSSLSLRPMDFSCVLKLSKSQLQENAFRDGCVQQVYELLMDYLNGISNTIGYPELMFPATVQMKNFLKTCKVGNYSRKIKQALDKMEENSKFITDKRNNVTFGISDLKAVDKWEKQVKEEGTPITKFYITWRKLRDQEILHSIAKKDQVKDFSLPTIDRKKFLENKKEDKEEFSELFASGSEDDNDADANFSVAIEKTERANEKKRVGEKKKKLNK